MSKLLLFIRLPILRIAIIACGLTSHSFAMDTVRIKRDPFQRPNYAGSAKGSSHSLQQISEVQAADSQPVSLRAIIFDPKKPLVNMGGQIIEVGATLHGYTLVKVSEREATFMRNGQPIKLSVDGVAGQ